jgi:ABC-type phosphate transport system substrate-binding protein
MPALTIVRSLAIGALLCLPVSADPYKRQERVDGALLVFSSLEAMNAATLLLDGFKKVYPNVRISLEGPHTRSEANALLNGFANLTLTDKKLSDEYVKYFEDRHGTLPTSLVAFKGKDGKEVSFGTVIYMPEDLDTIILEFMKFVYSDEGDAILRKVNFTPLPVKDRQEQLAKLRAAKNI